MATSEHEYRADIDYSRYSVTDADAPLLSTREAASRLGLSSNEGVRGLVARGRLPARRTARPYNAGYLIPAWAVEGRRVLRTSQPATRSDLEGGRVNTVARITALENALSAVREAAEHRERAWVLQAQATSELATANAVLERAVTGVLVPTTYES